MLRKLVSLFSLVCLALITGMTVSCGNSYSNTMKPCTGGPYNVVGDWNGTFTGGGATLNTVGAIDSSGLALFFDGFGDTVAMPAITGTCSFSGTITGYPAPGTVGTITPGTAQGNVTSATSITGSISNANGSGTLSLTASSPLSGAVTALSTSHFAVVGGGSDILNLTFTQTTPGSSMNFTGSDANSCTITGNFTQQGTSNVFDVSYTVSGAGAKCTASTSNGIGFESNTDYLSANGGQSPVYLYADIVASSGAFVVEVY